jgi:hypothetical protein
MKVRMNVQAAARPMQMRNDLRLGLRIPNHFIAVMNHSYAFEEVSSCKFVLYSGQTLCIFHNVPMASAERLSHTSVSPGPF